MTFFFKSETEKHLKLGSSRLGESPDKSLTRSLEECWDELSDDKEDDEHSSEDDILRLGM